MTTKMKGLLKGLRYISQIFEKEDEEEEEEEMQIGFPTDVKHVAHIGWDGPAVSSPSWMNEFKGTPEAASNPLNPVKQKERSGSKSPSQDYSSGDSSARNGPDLPKPSRRRNSKSDASSFDSSTQEGSVPKQSSRRQKSNSGDSSESTKSSRRNKSSSSTNGIDSSASSQDPTAIPKQTKKKKSKGSSGDGSTKMRSKDSDTNTNETYPPIGFE
ncbi:hypothetical protein MKW92_020807 [Papaver armeniacum]|nr:hypothetical protein MKW92_020807 [Papaver armeniacum]